MGRPHIVIAGLGFGDESKGSIVNYLCSTGDYHTVIRYNGGSNAGHNVVLPSGRHHTFSQFGSGTFQPGVRTHLSRFMLVDPLSLASEYEHLKALHVSDALDRLSIDADALLITPWHREANQLRERQRNEGRHGSTGVGLGEAREYALRYPEQALRVGDCADIKTLRDKIQALCSYLGSRVGREIFLRCPPIEETIQVYRDFYDAVKIVSGDYLHGLLRQGPTVFEGAQGVLIDESYGFPPYNTWTNTTFANAQTLLEEAGEQGFRLGIIRTYMTRHGAGPFPTENASLTGIPEPHNVSGEWQGQFRVGHFDAVALRYALLATGGADGIALTHLDTAVSRDDLRVCTAYITPQGRITHIPLLGTPQPAGATALVAGASPVYHRPYLEWPKIVEQETGVPVVLQSAGPLASAKRFSSPWDLTSWSEWI